MRDGGSPSRVKFWQHPFNQELSRFDAWLWEKLDAHQISREEMGDILRAGLTVFTASGLPDGPDLDPVSLGVFRQMLHASRQRLLQLHPELEDELRNLSAGSRRI